MIINIHPQSISLTKPPTKLKILLVEDEPLMAEQVLNQLNDLGYKEISLAHSSDSALESYNKVKHDFAILDIGLNNSSKNGIDLSKDLLAIKEIPFIFLSGYSDSSTLAKVKAVSHSNYLIKPCSTRQLFVSIDAAIDQFMTSKTKASQISSSQCPLYSFDDYFFIKGTNNAYERVDVSDIIWIEAVRGGIEIHLKDDSKYMLTASMSSFILQFNNPNLIRVHRSFMINKNMVRSIQERAFVLVTITGNKVIPCSQSYWSEIKNQFKTLKSD